MRNHYQLGPLRIDLEGRGPVVDALRDELRPIETRATTPADVEFVFVDRLEPLREYVRIPPLLVARDAFQVEYEDFAYQVRRDAERLRVRLCIRHTRYRRDPVRTAVKRWSDWNYLTPAETVAKNFMYSIFDWVTQLALVERGACYLHASSFAKDDRAVAIVAWGGIGKTTSMLKLVIEDGWRFMSDDLGLIDRDGKLWRTPKKLQVYAYNVANQPHLASALLRDRSIADRSSWQWRLAFKGPKRVRRRIGAEALFGLNGVTTAAPLTDVFFIERAAVDDFRLEVLGADTLADRAATILLDELQPFTEFAVAMHSSSHPTLLPSPVELHAKARDVLTAAFDGHTARHILIPLDAGPDALANFLRRQIGA